MKTAYELARAEIGTKETVGPAHNAKVLAYFKDAGHPEIVDDETAWCAAFVGAMLKRAGIKPTGSLAARSYLKWGEPVALNKAEPGDIAVFQRGDSSWQGHVAFFVRPAGTHLVVLGGNQSNAVNESRYPVAKLLGIRRAPATAPTPVSAPKTPASPTSPPTGGIWAAIARFIASLFASKASRPPKR